MNNQAIFWSILSLIGLLLVVFAWKKGGINKKDNYKGLISLGYIFTFIGLIEKIKYGEWDFLLLGIIFLGGGLIVKAKRLKEKMSSKRNS